MGLDMYAVSKAPGLAEGAPVNRLHYWRKHNALHGWMERLWESKGRPCVSGMEDPSPQDPYPEGTSFNCIALELTSEDLDKLEQDIKNKQLKPVEGFFFGNTNYDPSEDAEDDLKFVANARAAIERGEKVYYDSWW